MAKVRNNAITTGLSGKYGNQIVFRQVGDKTFAVKKQGPRNKAASPAQQANEERFRQAVAYARAAMADPVMKSIYEAGRGRRPVFRVAMSDFRKPPQVRSIDVSGYTGLPGEKIVVAAIDDFKVVAVNVAIYNAGGLLVEEGAANIATDGVLWVYTAMSNVVLPGGRLIVTARDYPGNNTMQELVFP
jgi:hypothetical protein